MARSWAWSRVRLVGGAAAVGVLAGAVALTLLVAWAGEFQVAVRKAFGLGAVIMGFGLLSWSGAALAGGGYEAMQAHLDTGTDWTERKARRAMARVGGFGAGWMVVVSVADAIARA